MNGARRNILSAIQGPILLITLGTLVAADYFAGYRFWRTWPILLIVFGVLKLLERIATPTRKSYRPPGDDVI